MKKFVSLAIWAGLLQSCAFSVHNVHVSGFDPYSPKSEGKLVTASAERFSVLGFSDDTSYIDQAYAQLKSRCDDADLVGVSTEIQTALGFFSWTDRVYMRGTCMAKDSGPSEGDKPEDGKPKRKKKV